MIREDYFKWLSDLVCKRRYSREISFDKLLRYLHDTEFRYSIPKDENRAEDGIALRYRFAHSFGLRNADVQAHLNEPCSVLEMMIALSIRCEEDIMDNPMFGDRIGQWFWSMITNLGLGSMMDYNFDEYFVRDTVERFLDREYAYNGEGGLFTVRDCNHDLRDVEIWIQLLWHINDIT